MKDETLEIEKTAEELQAEREQAYADLTEWNVQSEQLKELKASEMKLRNKVVQYFFPDGLKEGINKAKLPEGWLLGATGSINRKIDVTVQYQVLDEIAKEFEIDAGEMIKYKPELDLPAYRELQKDIGVLAGKPLERAQGILKLINSMLIITDGSPQLELIPPKKPKVKVIE